MYVCMSVCVLPKGLNHQPKIKTFQWLRTPTSMFTKDLFHRQNLQNFGRMLKDLRTSAWPLVLMLTEK